MGKTKQAEKKFDRNVEISAPILDPEIIRAIHSPPRDQKIDIRHGGFKALLSDLNSQDSTDELTPITEPNHLPSYIGISCAVSGYSSYSSYGKKLSEESMRVDPKRSTAHRLAAGYKPSRSRTSSPSTRQVEQTNVHHVTVDKSNINSIEQERKELTEKLTASATERHRSPSPLPPPPEDDRHHGAYVGARYFPMPEPSKLVHKHIPLLGIDDDVNPDEVVVEDVNKVEHKIASLYGEEFVEDWKESMSHKARKEHPDDKENQADSEHSGKRKQKNLKDLVTLKPTPPKQEDVTPVVDVPTPNVKVLAGVEKQFLNRLLTDENPPMPKSPSPQPTSPVSPKITRRESPTRPTEALYNQPPSPKQEKVIQESPKASPAPRSPSPQPPPPQEHPSAPEPKPEPTPEPILEPEPESELAHEPEPERMPEPVSEREILRAPQQELGETPEPPPTPEPPQMMPALEPSEITQELDRALTSELSADIQEEEVQLVQDVDSSLLLTQDSPRNTPSGQEPVQESTQIAPEARPGADPEDVAEPQMNLMDDVGDLVQVSCGPEPTYQAPDSTPVEELKISDESREPTELEHEFEPQDVRDDVSEASSNGSPNRPRSPDSQISRSTVERAPMNTSGNSDNLLLDYSQEPPATQAVSPILDEMQTDIGADPSLVTAREIITQETDNLVSFSPEPSLVETNNNVEPQVKQASDQIVSEQEETIEKYSPELASIQETAESIATQEVVESVDKPITADSEGAKNDGHYFLNLLKEEESFIMEKVREAEQKLAEHGSEMDEDRLGKIHSAIGKANLLINKKCNQFKGLCEQSLNGNANEQYAVLSDDLAGFWDMISIQIADVRKSFENL